MSLKRFRIGDSAAIAYGLIAAGIAVIVIAVVEGVGGGFFNTFTSVHTALN